MAAARVFAHLTDTVTDPGIKELAVLIRCLVITDHPAAYSSEHFIKDRDVKIIQFLENLETHFLARSLMLPLIAPRISLAILKAFS